MNFQTPDNERPVCLIISNHKYGGEGWKFQGFFSEISIAQPGGARAGIAAVSMPQVAGRGSGLPGGRAWGRWRIALAGSGPAVRRLDRGQTHAAGTVKHGK
jgi:hypothetical protein